MERVYIVYNLYPVRLAAKADNPSASYSSHDFKILFSEFEDGVLG
jgi:hypothetical protein